MISDANINITFKHTKKEVLPYKNLIILSFHPLNLIPMNPLLSTSLSSSISSGEIKAGVSLLIVMPGGRLNFSRIFRIVSVFLVRQTMVRWMGVLFFIFCSLYCTEYLVCHLRHPCVS